MARSVIDSPLSSDIAIFGRLLSQEQGRMAPSLARYVLRLGFSDEEQTQIEELAARNQEGRLSAAEKEQLMGYVKAGHLLALLHAQARKALKHRKAF